MLVSISVDLTIGLGSFGSIAGTIITQITLIQPVQILEQMILDKHQIVH